MALKYVNGIGLDVDKLTPWLSMRMKALHESGIAVCATVRAASVTIEGVIADG